MPAASGQGLSPAELKDDLAVLSAAESINDSGPAGVVPALRGFNASMGTSQQHDSSNGWSWILNPNAAYRVNKYFSVDAGTPIYIYINIEDQVGTKTKPVYEQSIKHGAFGDTSLSFEGDLSGPSIDWSGTFTLGLPSGNADYGLSAGRTTYNFNNHFEKQLGIFIPDVELGFGDTSNLVEQRVLKSYVAVGPMAHFQVGTLISLPKGMTFEADAYEQLPTAKSLVYSTTVKGKKKVTTATNIDPSEDNGFITSLDIPVTPHMTMSGFYSRSLRDHDDVAGFSFTFLLKGQSQSLASKSSSPER
ncbi:MAG TPA: hypothetical protein VGU46_07075 [Acidobacteriaceae bacterium]|nr:hypothetical protein [Acidobacteriaceae bacterium]